MMIKESIENIILHDQLENIFSKGDYCWARREDSLTISGKFKPRPPYKLHVEWKKCHHWPAHILQLSQHFSAFLITSSQIHSP
jgi:hypothetical protein